MLYVVWRQSAGGRKEGTLTYGGGLAACSWNVRRIDRGRDSLKNVVLISPIWLFVSEREYVRKRCDNPFRFSFQLSRFVFRSLLIVSCRYTGRSNEVMLNYMHYFCILNGRWLLRAFCILEQSARWSIVCHWICFDTEISDFISKTVTQIRLCQRSLSPLPSLWCLSLDCTSTGLHSSTLMESALFVNGWDSDEMYQRIKA